MRVGASRPGARRDRNRLQKAEKSMMGWCGERLGVRSQPTRPRCRHRIGIISLSRHGILTAFSSSSSPGFINSRALTAVLFSLHAHCFTMATLRTVCRAPLRQLCPRPSFAIATNHPRLPPRQWRGYASSADSQHKVSIRTLSGTRSMLITA